VHLTPFEGLPCPTLVSFSEFLYPAQKKCGSLVFKPNCFSNVSIFLLVFFGDGFQVQKALVNRIRAFVQE
jgi:hypothetical protein